MRSFVDNLTARVGRFIQLVDSNPIDWGNKSAPGKWSNKEIIGHLTDSAQINLQRFVRCTYEENFKLVYAQDEWVKVQHYQDMEITDLLQLWRLLNLQIARVLDNYPSDRLSSKCDNSKNEVSLHTVEWLAQDYIGHLQHHLNQIKLK
jgi:DinB superfamily